MLSYQFYTSERKRHKIFPLKYRMPGVYHYPKEEAARIALNAIGEEMAHGYEGEVIVCCFSEKDAEVYRKLLSC